MASRAEVRAILSSIAAEMGPRRGWVEDESDGWARAFADTPTADLERAAARWCVTEDRVPNLAKFRRLLSTVDTARTVAEGGAGCGACVGGWRRVVRHIAVGGRTVVEDVAARCRCLAGQAVARDTPVGSYDDVESRWRRSPDTVAGPWVDPDPVQIRTPEQIARLAQSAGRWDVAALVGKGEPERRPWGREWGEES